MKNFKLDDWRTQRFKTILAESNRLLRAKPCAAVSFRRRGPQVSFNLMFYLNPNCTDCDECTHLQINLVFTEDSSKSLVYDVLQLNVLHKDCSFLQKVFDNTGVVSWDQVKRNPQIFANPKFCLNLHKVLKYTLLETHLVFNLRLTESRGLRLPVEPQEGRNRSWAVKEFSANL
ncbi:hypothetical protein CSKR_108595 [Clonorchis sinensis]|uniref:Uncharacterized protein n=1 Tax=Clonorchis sinensis TaxID=79923 RepID=A0A3R7K1A7_CLOSI|nr:hypothetical protein CSKR_108595 [Clonorchis sinensis]